jgi:tetratricopeptide (TPR) repeat protein
LFVVYQNFWKPDPVFQAAIGLRTDAENLLIVEKHAEALIAVNQALELTPGDPYLLILRGVIYEKLDEPELAEKDFENAKEGFPSEDLFYSTRAGYYNMAGSPEAALRDAETAIELNPDSAMAFIREAQAYELLNDITNAIKYYELASDVAERTGNPQIQVIARMNMGQLLQALPALGTQPSE